MPRTQYNDAMSHGPRDKAYTVLGAKQGEAAKPKSKDAKGRSLTWMKPLFGGATRTARTGFSPEDAKRYTTQTGETLKDMYYEEMDTSLGRGVW